MATSFDSLPPPGFTPASPPPMQTAAERPVAFRSDRTAASGSRGTLFIAEPQPGTFTFTGEFYEPRTLSAFRIGQTVISFGILAALIGALVVAVNRPAGSDTPPAALGLVFASVAASVGLIVWKAIVMRTVRPGTVAVRAVDVCRVRSTANYRMLWWWLLIGPLALVPMFVGRHRLRMDLPIALDGRPGTVGLLVLEQVKGDAEIMASRMRAAGAR